MPDGNAIRTQRTRARILAESLQLFNDAGEARATTGMIAAAAGISPGNLHYHFRTREAIVDALVDAFDRAMDVPPGQGASPAEAVEDLWLALHLMLEALLAYRFVPRDLDALAARDRRLGDRLRRILQRQHRVLATLCRTLAATGAMRASEAEIEALATNVLLVAMAWPSYPARGTDAAGARQVMHLVIPHLGGDARRHFERLGRSYAD